MLATGATQSLLLSAGRIHFEKYATGTVCIHNILYVYIDIHSPPPTRSLFLDFFYSIRSSALPFSMKVSQSRCCAVRLFNRGIFSSTPAVNDISYFFFSLLLLLLLLSSYFVEKPCIQQRGTGEGLDRRTRHAHNKIKKERKKMGKIINSPSLPPVIIESWFDVIIHIIEPFHFLDVHLFWVQVIGRNTSKQNTAVCTDWIDSCKYTCHSRWDVEYAVLILHQESLRLWSESSVTLPFIILFGNA